MSSIFGDTITGTAYHLRNVFDKIDKNFEEVKKISENRLSEKLRKKIEKNPEIYVNKFLEKIIPQLKKIEKMIDKRSFPQDKLVELSAEKNYKSVLNNYKKTFIDDYKNKYENNIDVMIINYAIDPEIEISELMMHFKVQAYMIRAVLGRKEERNSCVYEVLSNIDISKIKYRKEEIFIENYNLNFELYSSIKYIINGEKKIKITVPNA